jgi:hypothetical protein
MKALKRDIKIIIRNIFSYAFAVTLIFGCTNIDMNAQSGEQQKNCLTIENFNFVASFIEDNSEKMNVSERLLSEKESLVLEISFEERFVQPVDYKNYKKIIIIDKNGDNKIPPYFVSIENNKIQISAYYSRLDTDEDLKIRTEDWCNIVSVLTKKQ